MILNLTIDATGHVSHAEVATSAGPGREAFDAAAVAAATGYLFEPAESDGQPVPVELAYKVKFRLRAKAPAPPPPTAAAAQPAAPVAAPRPPRESLTGLLRERGTRSPLIGVVVTATKEGESPAAGVRGDQRRQRPLRLLRSRAGHLARRRRGARLLPLPHQRGGARRGEDRRDLLRRARPGEPARRDGDRRAPEEGRHPRRADRRRDRQGAGHGGRSAGGAPEPGGRGPRARRQRPA